MKIEIKDHRCNGTGSKKYAEEYTRNITED